MNNAILNKYFCLNNQTWPPKFKMAAVNSKSKWILGMYLPSMFFGLKMTIQKTDVGYICLWLYNYIDSMQTKIQIGHQILKWPSLITMSRICGVVANYLAY